MIEKYTMGMTEILQILKNGDKLTASEIAELTEATICAVHVSIGRLLKDVSENLITRELTPEEKKEKFGRMVGCKVKIYWLDE